MLITQGEILSDEKYFPFEIFNSCVVVREVKLSSSLKDYFDKRKNTGM